MGSSPQKTRKKGHGRTSRRKAKLVAYYEITYPLRKLRRIFYALRAVGAGTRLNALKKWADSYKSPNGLSANAILVRFAKEKKFAL